MKSQKKSEEGFVSIFSVLIIMAVLTLLAIGFSNITRQAQRRTLDSQLNTQAFYAAESGINDATAAIAAVGNIKKDTCQGASVPARTFNYTLDTNLGISYSCLLINNEPLSLVYDSVPVVGKGEPIVVPMTTTQPIRSLKFSWDSPEGSAGVLPTNGFDANSSPVLPTASSWGNKVGILRVDIVPLDSYNRQDLVERGYTFFMYPTLNSAGGTTLGAVNGAADKAGTALTRCDIGQSPRCTMTITLYANYIAGNVPTSLNYVLRMQSFYNPVRMEVRAYNAANVALPIRNAQVVIDATGKASDVFRRIQVRRPVTPNTGVHEPFAILSADSLCKRLIAVPNGTVVDPAYASDPACTLGL